MRRLLAAAAILLLMASCDQGTPSQDAAPAPTPPSIVVPPDVTFSNADVGLGGPTDVPEPAGRPVRIEIHWWTVEPHEGAAYDWRPYDAAVARAAAAGMKILMLITYAPPWATGRHSDKWFPRPEYDAGWTRFVGAVVRRYGDRVRAYEVWNEPNHAKFGNYGDGHDETRLRRYWNLVRITSERIRTVCPACLVLAGGSAAGSRPAGQPRAPSSRPNPNSPAAWLDWAYRHGYGDTFDAVAHHPYPRWTHSHGPSASFCGRPDLSQFGPAYRPGRPYREQCGQLAALRAVLVDHGDGHKLIWGTEWGYPTRSFLGARHAPLRLVRDFSIESVNLWRTTYYLGPLIRYEFRDSCTTPRDPECHYGLVDAAGRPKEPLYSDLISATSG